MLQSELIGEEFLRHVATRPSGFVVCSAGAAFEAWFQVELAHMLLMKGLNSVRFGYDYPDSRQKADLAVEAEWGPSVIELKCFVRGADANKMKTWPSQLNRLLNLVESGGAAQGMAVSTYFGYSEQKTADLIFKFHPSPWRHFGPRRFYENAPLRLVVGTVTPLDVSPSNEVQ
jgi:hypothetical protein